MLVLCPGRYYDNTFKDLTNRRHEFFSAIFYPSLACICDDISLSSFDTKFEHIFCGFFQLRNLFQYFRINFLIGVEISRRIDETRAHDGIVPVKNDCCFIEFRLILWSQPYFIVCQLRQKSSTYIIGGPILLDEVKIDTCILRLLLKQLARIQWQLFFLNDVCYYGIIVFRFSQHAFCVYDNSIVFIIYPLYHRLNFVLIF